MDYNDERIFILFILRNTCNGTKKCFQDELIAVKLREAEASLSLKDLRQRVTELSESWQRHLQVMTVLSIVFRLTPL